LPAVALAAAVTLTGCAGGGHRPPAPSADLDESGFRRDVRTLASDEFEGRLPGTPGEEKTVAFLVDQFKKLGLKPGIGESYVQQVPLVGIALDTAPTLTISGHGAATALAYTQDMVIWTRREVSEATLRGSELVFVGYGIVAPEYAWNDYQQIDVHGKTVVVMLADPGYGTKDPAVFRGNALTHYGEWAYKVEEAARQGAAGILLIHDAGATGYPWAVVLNDRTGPQFAITATDGSGDRPAVEGWLSANAARALFNQAGLDFESSTGAAARPGFRAVPMGLTADASIHNTLRRFVSSNVIALLPGAGHKREYVIYTAHWDHLGRQAAAVGGALRNGAVDDASGVAGLLMLAQSFSRTRPRPDRSLAFIAFTAADAGLLGSTFYVDEPVIPLRDTVAVLNLDIPYIGGPTRDVMIFGYGNSELDDYVREVAALQGRELQADADPQHGAFYRSDQYNFAKVGVPTLYARAGLDDSARGPAWGREQLADYMLRRYHQPADKYSTDWDVRGTLEDLGLYYEIGARLAHSRRFPRFYPNSEFRVDRTP
jgi:Zn-dependent M28 family amino/carboxypeptidase